MRSRFIEGWPGYLITDDGRVWSEKVGRYLKPMLKKRGYWMVNLSRIGGERWTVGLHRLVAITFVPNPENKPQINHKDGDKNNNHYTNFEWVTAQENHDHARSLNLMAKGEQLGKLTEERVLDIRARAGTGPTYVEIGQSHGVTKQTVCDIVKRRSWGWL